MREVLEEWRRHLAHMGEKLNAYKNLVRKSEGKKLHHAMLLLVVYVSYLVSFVLVLHSV
jgi:hypothetical protein